MLDPTPDQTVSHALQASCIALRLCPAETAWVIYKQRSEVLAVTYGVTLLVT